jgi:tetratricopeptide (TPR) repeat protein
MALTLRGARRPRTSVLERAAALVATTSLAFAVVAPGVLALSALSTTSAAASAASTTSTTAATPTGTRSKTADRIVKLAADLKVAPKDGFLWLDLGSSYVRRAFETADPSFYPIAESSLAKAQSLIGRTPEVLGAQATLALARHRFTDARAIASTLVKERPASLDGRISLVDANIELGHYDVASNDIEQLVDQRPNVATLSRLSYSRQLGGDLRRAEATMRQAASAASAGSFDRAVALGYLGDVLLEGGHLDAAGRSYDEALRIDPTVSAAVLGRARVAMAHNDAATAVSVLESLIARTPQPGALGLRSDIARATGDTSGALANDQLVDATVKLFEANGAVVDAELAVLLADRGRADAPAALAAAKRAYADRRTIFTNDAMAWALFAAGKPKDALSYAREAVRSAPAVASVRWHAAAVMAAAGDVTSARVELIAALRNPWFSPTQRPALVALAKKLGVVTAATDPTGAAASVGFGTATLTKVR